MRPNHSPTTSRRNIYFTSLRRSNRSLKEFLLDQTKVCGLGNIYAAEAMFLAGIHPAKNAAKLSRKRTQTLYEKIRLVLTEAIDAGSTLNTDPQNPEIGYYGGRYEDYWRVYGREDLPCPGCQKLDRQAETSRSLLVLLSGVSTKIGQIARHDYPLDSRGLKSQYRKYFQW